MNTHAYERFKASGFKYDVSNLDTSNMSLMDTLENVELDNKFTYDFKKSGKYIVEIEFTSPLTSLAQIAISLDIERTGICTFVAKGTDGGTGVMKSYVSIVQGEKNLTFTSKADVTIKSVRFLL